MMWIDGVCELLPKGQVNSQANTRNKGTMQTFAVLLRHLLYLDHWHVFRGIGGKK
jgi:hypothetical protein